MRRACPCPFDTMGSTHYIPPRSEKLKYFQGVDAWSERKLLPKNDPPKKPTVEELYFRSDSAYLCLLLNRRTRFIRVIDFRAGALPAKRLYIQSVATQEKVDKVITLVEKDEVSSWTRVGFVREGTIPGFYKRSDGHLCGCVIGDKTASIEVTDASAKLTERTINAAKKAAADIPDKIKGASVRTCNRKGRPLGTRCRMAQKSSLRIVRHVRAGRAAGLLRHQSFVAARPTTSQPSSKTALGTPSSRYCDCPPPRMRRWP